MDQQQQQLETRFRGIPDHDLIRELVRRERLGAMNVSVLTNHPETEVEGFRDMLIGRLAAEAGRELAKGKERAFAVNCRANHPDGRTVYYADIVFLRPKPEESFNDLVPAR